MNQMNIVNNDEIELDIPRLAHVVWSRKWLIFIASVACALVMLVGTKLFITPKYQASAMFYVNNNAFSMEDVSLSSITSSDITASKNLVNSYIVILKTRASLLEVVEYAGVDLSYSELVSMISAESVEETEIFRVVVTSADPGQAETLANAIAHVLPDRISSIIEGTSAKVVDSAVKPSSPSSPSYLNNVIVGFLLGFILSAGAVILRELFNTTINSEEAIMHCCKHPVLAAVPDMSVSGKNGSYYGYGSKKHNTPKNLGKHNGDQPALIGNNINFAAAEAYKLLRTKLQFSFADENSCHVIGLSSALSGEGKSLTAINLAHTLSQLDRKVVLIDCDMRRPTLAEKLNIHKKPGLSSFLTGQINADQLLQYCGIPGDERAFGVIAAGECPPNPIELLSSERMTRALDNLRDIFDYVILDLPPVGEVSDALAIAKQVDGMLLVVRQNYCTRPVLGDAVRQFESIDARVLGLVFNCTRENSGKYGKGYYKKGYS